jgi:hypothetical protein
MAHRTLIRSCFYLAERFTPERAKHDSLVRVQKNYPDILVESQKSGNACSAYGSVAFIPAHECGGLSPRSGNHQKAESRDQMLLGKMESIAVDTCSYYLSCRIPETILTISIS